MCLNGAEQGAAGCLQPLLDSGESLDQTLKPYQCLEAAFLGAVHLDFWFSGDFTGQQKFFPHLWGAESRRLPGVLDWTWAAVIHGF